MGYESKTAVKTPQLDAFAKERFTSKQMVTNYSLCSPSRAMAEKRLKLTGQMELP